MSKTLTILDWSNLKAIMSGDRPLPSISNKASILRLTEMGLVKEKDGDYLPIPGESYTYAGSTHTIITKY